MNIAFTDLVLYFMIYSFIGWVCEVVYCSIPTKKFINRGFLSGPLCPIYGFGAIIILFLLHPFKENPLLLFVFAMLSTTLLEYVTSWAMEVLFDKRWWDYSNQKFNINGRVYLKNSLIFGAMGIIVTYFVHPLLTQLLMGISENYKHIIAITFLVSFGVDHLMAFKSLLGSTKGSIKHKFS